MTNIIVGFFDSANVPSPGVPTGYSGELQKYIKKHLTKEWAGRSPLIRCNGAGLQYRHDGAIVNPAQDVVAVVQCKCVFDLGVTD